MKTDHTTVIPRVQIRIDHPVNTGQLRQLISRSVTVTELFFSICACGELCIGWCLFKRIFGIA